MISPRKESLGNQRFNKTRAILAAFIVLFACLHIYLQLMLAATTNNDNAIILSSLPPPRVAAGQSIMPQTKPVQAKPAATSPACKPHFRLALPDGTWTNATKFKRIYFYHARKTGVSRIRALLVTLSINSVVLV